MAQRIDQIGYNNRDEIIKEIQLRLADGMVDVELDREHYDIAINKFTIATTRVKVNLNDENYHGYKSLLT